MSVARTISRRSLCSRDRVGAVIVDRDNRVVDTGYNGPPRGFARDPLHHADEVRGVPQKTCEHWCARGRNALAAVTLGASLSTYDDCPSLHAEQNALMFSDRRLREGGTIYVSSTVCGTCAKLIANSGLAEVVCAMTESTRERRNATEWIEFMEKCGITVTEYPFTDERVDLVDALTQLDSVLASHDVGNAMWYEEWRTRVAKILRVAENTITSQVRSV